MTVRFEELDWRATPMGELVLRRRWDPRAGREVYEIKLGDEFLMSSLFTIAEMQLARRAVARTTRESIDVAVGGLGYTAQTVLEYPAVRSLVVIEALNEVIEWHENALIPVGTTLLSDPRCELVRGDFFAMLRTTARLDPLNPARRFHAIVVDIDHSPRHLLHASHADFYQPTGLQRLAQHLHDGGVFALWSNDPPDEEFTAALEQNFDDVRADVIRFDNPLQHSDGAATIYSALLPHAQ